MADREPPFDQPVFVWLDDVDLLGEVGRRCLALGCDRVEIATLDDDGRKALLLRLDSPPYYIIAWCRELGPERAQVFTAMPGSPGLFLEWGWTHPLAALWQQRWRVDEGGWLFFTPGHPSQERRQVDPADDWRSIYDALELTIDIEETERWALSNREVEPFEVALRLEPRLRPLEPEFILAGPADRHALEDQLAMADDTLLDGLEVSVQRDPSGEVVYLMRQRSTRADAALEGLPGRRFARFRGLERLLVPHDRTLRPSLRRDRYRALFDLGRGELTLVVPGQRDHSVRLLRVPEASFVGFGRLVEHFVGFEPTQIQTILDGSLFDLGRYTESPNLSIPSDGKRSSREVGEPREDDDEPQEATTEEPALEPQEPAPMPELDEPDDEPEVAATGELEQRALELEREIILEGPRVDRWQALADVQRARRHVEDAAHCALEAYWCAAVGRHFGAAGLDGADADAPRRQFLDIIAEGATQAGLELWRPVVAALEPTADLADWQLATDRALREMNDDLPIKLRWLAWRGLLAESRDERTFQEQRDLLLDRLNDRGLTPKDTPPCVRDHILTRPLDEAPADQRVGVQVNLTAVGAFLRTGAQEDDAPDPLRIAGCASAARVAARHGWDSAVHGFLAAAGADAGSGDGGQPRWTQVADALTAPERLRALRQEEGDQTAPVAAAWTTMMAERAARASGRGAAAQTLRTGTETWLTQCKGSAAGELRRVADEVDQREVAEASKIVPAPRSIFPSNALTGIYAELVGYLEAAHERGSADEVFELARDGIEVITEELEEGAADLRDAAVLLRRIVAVLRRHQWDQAHDATETLVPLVTFLERALADQSILHPMYHAVAPLVAARALLDLGQEDIAIGLAHRTLQFLATTPIACLDFIDVVRGEALMVAELLPPERRRQTLQLLMRAVGAQQTAHVSFLKMPSFAVHWLEMLDQICEAAVSESRYAHRLLRDWEEREEFMIRQVLGRDRPHHQDAPETA